MVCKYCNHEIPSGSTVCQNCGAAVDNQAQNHVHNVMPNQGNPAPEYNSTKSIIFLIWGFFCTCFYLGVIFSILSLVSGSKVASFNATGNYQEAHNAYQNSEKWNKLALIFNIIGSVLLPIAILILIFGFGITNYRYGYYY